MTHRLYRACAALACLACLSGPTFASHDHSTQVAAEAEFFKDAGVETGMHLPGGTNLADFAESSREPGPKGNETPGMVRGEISDLKDLKLMNDFLNPTEASKVARQLEAAEVRLAIAEKRQQRDRLRKKKKVREADAMEAEVHRLKAKLIKLQPPKSGFADLFKADDEDPD